MSDPTRTTTSPDHNEQRERILSAAMAAFSARGYHAASMEEISSESGIDSRSVSAFFPAKYELFREVVMTAAEQMLKATETAGMPVADQREARAALTRIIEGVARVSIATRASAGFYRAEIRYLESDDLLDMRERLAELRRRVREPLMRLRPTLSEPDADLIATAALSAIASITIHPTTLPEAKIQTLLVVSAMRLLDSDLNVSPNPALGAVAEFALTPPTWPTDTSPRGIVLAAAIRLFYSRGYNAVTMDDIAGAAGVTLQQVTAHFANTSEMLRDACLDGNIAVSRKIENALQSSSVPREVLAALSSTYVRHSFSDPQLMTVYLADARNLADENRAAMIGLQREFISHWVSTLRSVRPELSVPEASFLVFAGLSVVADLGRVTKWQQDETTMVKIAKLVLCAMTTTR